MKLFHARVLVTLRRSILDPQGKAVEHAVHTLGHSSVDKVRIGRVVELDLRAASHEDAEKVLHEISHKLLSNPVMEDYTFTLSEAME